MIAGTPKPIAPVGRLPFAFAKRHGVLVRAVIVLAVEWGILYWMYRRKIFLRA